MAKKKDKTYRAGAYKRLSQDDGRGEVSNSIINQTELIKDYGKSHSNIEIVAEYDDDGYSGTNFDRPGFLRMMEDIKAKKIDCVIVKDLSRFGRNYIEVGKYIERIFPFMGVRFISINDNYDSEGKKEESDSLMLPFKNLVNDAYCRDISVKIRSQLDIKRKKGECISAFAVYGYQKSQEDKNRLEVDVYAAEIVQTIFRMKLQGSNQQRIADFLNDNGVLSPLEYKKSIGLKYSTSFKIHPVALWSVNAINRILTEEAYTGVMAQGKTSTPNYKVKTQIAKKPEEWIRVEGAHEAIIGFHDFQTVQELLKRDTRTAPEQKELYLFSGYLFCGDCKNSMVRKAVPSGGRKYFYYVCSTNKHKKECSSHSISEKKLTDRVFHAIQDQIETVCRMDEFLTYIDTLPEHQREVFNYDAQIGQLRQEIQKYKRMKMKLYEDLSDGIIDEKEYQEYRGSFSKRITEKEQALERLEHERKETVEGNRSSSLWIQEFKKYRNVPELSRQMVTTLVDKVMVYEEGRMEVVFRYADEIAMLLAKIENYQGGSDMPELALAQ